MIEPEPVVHVVEDDEISRTLIIALAESAGLICKPFADARQFLDHYDAGQRGCLVLDVFMPGMSGMQLQTELNRRGAIIPVIFVTGNAAIPDVVAAMREGAYNYLLKPFRNAELLANIHGALAHDRQNRQSLAQIDEIQQRILSLTAREREILELLARGCVNKSMALEMHISPRTIELHRSRMMRKMGADSVAQLIRMFMEFERRRIRSNH